MPDPHELRRLRLGTPDRPWSDADCKCGWSSGQWTIDRAAEAGIKTADEMEARLRADHEAHAEGRRGLAERTKRDDGFY